LCIPIYPPEITSFLASQLVLTSEENRVCLTRCAKQQTICSTAHLPWQQHCRAHTWKTCWPSRREHGSIVSIQRFTIASHRMKYKTIWCWYVSIANVLTSNVVGSSRADSVFLMPQCLNAL
jgi:hypothetical protein